MTNKTPFLPSYYFTFCVCIYIYIYIYTYRLVVASKENGLEVNADKTKYVVMSREQTAGLSYTMKVDNSSIERVEEFKYLGTTLRNQNSIQEEIKSRLKLGNACYHSVQNLLSSSLLSKNLKIRFDPGNRLPSDVKVLFKTHRKFFTKLLFDKTTHILFTL